MLALELAIAINAMLELALWNKIELELESEIAVNNLKLEFKCTRYRYVL